MCADLDNVQLYFFDNEHFTDDIANYMDLAHYSQEFNSLILRSIGTGKNRLTPENVEQHIELLKKRVLAYDLKAVNDYVQEGLQQLSTAKK